MSPLPKLSTILFAAGAALALASPAAAQSLQGQWVQTTSRLGVPGGAVVAGIEGGGVNYVCRALYNNNSVHPGKLVNGYCYFGYGGREVQVPNYEVLVGVSDNRLWGSPTLAGAVNAEGGIENGRALRVCRARLSVNGQFIGVLAGKELPGHCHVAWSGQEYPVDTYEVLYASLPTAPPAPVTRTTQTGDGYATFGGGCVGKNGDEFLIVRMGGRSSDVRQFVFDGPTRIHMYVPQGTTMSAACGAYPSPQANYTYKTLD